MQLVQASSWSSRLLILALLLLAPEQAHMAGADLRQIQSVQRRHPDHRLQAFYRVVWATIVGQLLGFYLAAVGQFGGGLVMILGSLIGFNLLAPIRLAPGDEAPIIACGPQDRIDVLVLNSVAGGLGCLWWMDLGRFWAAVGILLIAAVYVAAKFKSYYKTWRKSASVSLAHAASAAEEHP